MSDIKCSICGLKLSRYLVQCSECGLWFCNQIHDDVSDIIQHMQWHAQMEEKCTFQCSHSAIGCDEIAC